MAISFFCTGCSNQLQVPDEVAGSKAKCPVCGTVMVVPEVVTAEEVTAYQESASQTAPQGTGSAYGGAGVSPQGANTYGYQYQNSYGRRPDSPFMPEMQPRRFSIGEVWDDTWFIFKSRLWPIVGVVLLAMVINGGAGMAEGMARGIAPLFGVVGMAFYMAVLCARYVFQAWIYAGLFVYLLNMVSDRNPNINDLFLGFRYLLRYVGASILIACGGIAIFVVFSVPVAGIFIAEGNQFNQQGFENAGPIFWVIGGVIAAIGILCLAFYYLTFVLWPLLLIDRNLGVMESLRMSAELMRGNRLNYFLMQFGVGLMAGLFALVTCFVGFFFAVPFMSLLTVVLYYHIAGLPIGHVYQED